FFRDAAGRIAAIQGTDGTRLVYTYDAAGNLLSAHNTVSGQNSRYGYAADVPHLLTLASNPVAGTGAAVSYGAVTQVLGLTADRGGPSHFTAADQAGTLSAGATDRYVFLLTGSELRSTHNGTVIVGVQVSAAAGSTFQPAAPLVAGLTPLAQRVGA